MLTIYGILIVTTLLAAFGSSTDTIQGLAPAEPSPVVEVFFATAMMLYVLSIFALFIVSYIYLCIHFYKTMYSDQGYLTHTLPVKPITLFNVKLLTSLVWLTVSLLLFLLSVFCLFIGATRGEVFRPEVGERIIYLIKHEFLTLFGMTFGQFVLFMIVSALFSCLSYLLMIFASISIGQLFTAHKVVGSIAAGIAIYFIQQTIGTIFVIGSGIVTYTAFSTQYTTFADVLFSAPMILSMAISVLFTIAFYIICIVMQTRHLNLD